MSRFPDRSAQGRGFPLDYSQAGGATVATFLNAVYAWMCVGLAVTAGVAWWVSTQPQLIQRLFGSGIFWVLVIAQLALVWTISAAVNRISAAAATGLFVLYAALNGLTLSVIFLVYQLGAITTAFAVTAGMFGAMSFIGFTTKKDLSSLGGILMMGLIGLIIASVVNIFFANGTLYWIINYAGVAIFLGLTVYDTQKLKEMAYATEGNAAMAARLAINGSLALYLDFLNLFLFMLRILGNRKE
jgi:hypothetical protein